MDGKIPAGFPHPVHDQIDEDGSAERRHEAAQHLGHPLGPAQRLGGDGGAAADAVVDRHVVVEEAVDVHQPLGGPSPRPPVPSSRP